MENYIESNRSDLVPEERRQQLFSYIYKNGSAKIAELASYFGVSEMTIRRDIEVLIERNLVMRSHGGVLYREGTVYDLGLAGGIVNHDKKLAIAKAALQFVEPGDLLAMDASTTGAELAKLLTNIEDLTIITNSLTIANVVAPYPNVEVILVGGNLRPRALSTVGPLASYIIEKFNFNKMFFSCNAVNFLEGLTDTNIAEAEMKKLMLQRAEKRFLLADSSKIGKKALVSFWPAQDIDYLITDSETNEEELKTLVETGIQVIKAEG